ncbi:unnamed protein product [Penicillium manginii]
MTRSTHTCVYQYNKKGTHGVNPATMKLHDLEKSTRVCKGDTCYFYVKAQSIANNGGWKQWKNAKGVDKTEKYGVDAFEFGEATEWYQDKYGSYLQVPTDASDFLSVIQDSSDSPAGSMYVNMPVVHYDNCKRISS